MFILFVAINRTLATTTVTNSWGTETVESQHLLGDYLINKFIGLKNPKISW
jgi:hypothetical protein